MDIEDNPESGLPQLDFRFVGGNLALDFVDTELSRRLPGTKRIIRFDQLWDITQIEVWWKAACAEHGLEGYEDHIWTKAESELLIRLRAELRSVFESIIAGDIESTGAPLLNGVLARGSFTLSPTAEGPRRRYLPRDGGADPLLAIALAAAELLAEGELSRIRGCRSERCILLFYDSTKSGTRHWCRPDCMNRARARANYRKAKEGGTA
jgi:predicted RNA-binding Zn ribbon-like protein